MTVALADLAAVAPAAVPALLLAQGFEALPGFLLADRDGATTEGRVELRSVGLEVGRLAGHERTGIVVDEIESGGQAGESDPSAREASHGCDLLVGAAALE